MLVVFPWRKMATHSSTLAWRIPGGVLWAAIHGVAQSRTWLMQLSNSSSSSFPYFLQFKSEFGNKEFIFWATVKNIYNCRNFTTSQTLLIHILTPIICRKALWSKYWYCYPQFTNEKTEKKEELNIFSQLLELLNDRATFLKRSHSEVPTYYQGKKRKGKKWKAYKPTILQG